MTTTFRAVKLTKQVAENMNFKGCTFYTRYIQDTSPAIITSNGVYENFLLTYYSMFHAMLHIVFTDL